MCNELKCTSSRIFAYCMRYFFSCLLLLIIGINGISAQPDSLLHTTYAKRYDYVVTLEKTVTRDVDNDEQRAELLDSLQKIADYVKSKGDDAFYYQLSLLPITSLSYMRKAGRVMEVSKQISKAEKEGYIFEATDARAQLANYFWRTDKREKGIEIGLNAYEVYKNFSVEEFPARTPIQSKLAVWYYNFADLGRAKELLLELLSAANNEVTEAMLDPIATLALCYREQKQYDSALIYFTQVYDYSRSSGNARKEALAVGNIGSLYYQTGKYNEAIRWSQRELALWKEINNNTTLPSVTAYIYIADASFTKGDIATARTYIDSADKLMRKVRRSFNNLKKFYAVKANVLAASGQDTKALLYKDSVMLMMDSLYAQRDKEQMLNAEQRVEQAKHEKEVEYLETLRKNSVWLRNFAIVMILMLAIISLLLINRSRLRHRQKELKAMSDRDKAENKLLHFTRQMQDKNRQIDNLREELQHASDEQDTVAKNEAIARLQQSTILTDDQWDEFRVVFEEVHSGFIGKLKTQFPALTPAELRYLTLLKLDLNNREMANMLGVSDGTVRNYKSRLRRKYNLADEDDLEEMLKNI